MLLLLGRLVVLLYGGFLQTAAHCVWLSLDRCKNTEWLPFLQYMKAKSSEVFVVLILNLRIVAH